MMIATNIFTAIDALKKEQEAEARTTRKMLSVVPAEKFDWKPHPKSMSLRTLATLGLDQLSPQELAAL